MEEVKSREYVPSFRKKLGNTTYTVKVHFDKQGSMTFKDKVQRLIINDLSGERKNN